jgi:hypothetical protein
VGQYASPGVLLGKPGHHSRGAMHRVGRCPGGSGLHLPIPMPGRTSSSGLLLLYYGVFLCPAAVSGASQLALPRIRKTVVATLLLPHHDGGKRAYPWPRFCTLPLYRSVCNNVQAPSRAWRFLPGALENMVSSPTPTECCPLRRGQSDTTYGETVGHIRMTSA